MAEIRAFRALRYDLAAVGGLGAVVAPPYDVIDEPMRAELVARSPFNVVEIDLPRGNGGDPYLHAQTIFEEWRRQGVLVHEREPALWALTQEYELPGGDGGGEGGHGGRTEGGSEDGSGGSSGDPSAAGERVTRHGFLCRVRVEEYGAGRIRPHERTHPGPKEDRLRLTRATRANLSPIFSLFPDPEGAAWRALEPAVSSGEPFGSATDPDGTINRLWRVADPGAIATVESALAGAELLIADGHHRYETARTYAEEVGGEGEHRYVLMLLCSMSDPGLTVLPTHRLVTGLDGAAREALSAALERDFEATELADPAELEPPAEAEGIVFGYLDSGSQAPVRLTLRDSATADAALAGHAEPYRRLETAVLEELILRRALGMSDHDIDELHGLAYTKDAADARRAVAEGRADAAFILRATPVEQVRRVAEAGEPMPPKSTYFHPKVPTGLVFNLLE